MDKIEPKRSYIIYTNKSVKFNDKVAGLTTRIIRPKNDAEMEELEVRVKCAEKRRDIWDIIRRYNATCETAHRAA